MRVLETSEGILIFTAFSIGGSMVLLRKQATDTQREKFNLGIHKFSLEPSNRKGFMTRNESEFSLGLDRSKSLPNLMSELGELCESGKAFVNITKVAALLAASITALSFIGYGVSAYRLRR